MRKLFVAVLFLCLAHAANAQLFVSNTTNCSDVKNPRTDLTYCLPASGTNANQLLVWKGSSWEIAINASSGGGAPASATYITQTPNSTLTNEQALNALTAGIMKQSSGVVARAIPGTDYENPLTFSSPLSRSTNTVSCPTASAIQSGCLSSTDWTTFNDKGSGSGSVTSITASSPLTGGTITTSGSIGCQAASGSQAGCLSSSDWSTFNNKQASGNYITALTGDVTASGPGSSAATIANAAVSLIKIQNASASSKLLGSGSSGIGGSYTELTLGTGLSMSGTTLTATVATAAKPYFFFSPLANEPPNSGFATTNLRNAHPILNFVDGSTTTAIFTGQLSSGYSGGGMDCFVDAVAATATTGNYVVGLAWERDAAGGQNIDSDGFATANTATSTTAGTNGVITRTSISFTDGSQMDSTAAGDMFRLRLQRIGADGSDTMTDTLQVVGLGCEES